ncbi:XoxI protein [Bacillus sp. AFS018417]|uniref:XoxI protein n=1 Tax=Bacillus sp. AFS018417 TaxID=2033491 RepID=UPI000BF94FC3|nr:XoxI protein [Bacillus sp. AFS018417]PEY98181.1 XoxI protein [Bacillus sp. AFS018417]
MKMKKPLIATVMGLSLLCFGTGASAAETDGVVDSDVIQSNKQAKPGMISTMAVPSNTSNTNTYTPFGGGTYAVSSSSSTTLEDYIYAKCRTFNGTDGSLINSNSASANRSSYISAKANNGTIYFANDWAIGNHTYKLSGYNDVVHETKAYW